MSSLIGLELEEDEKMTTEEFGQLWVQYQYEEKKRFECSILDCSKLAKRLSKSWHIQIIQVIGQECIALAAKEERNDVLLHITMLSSFNGFELTLKSKELQDIHQFLKSRQLLQ